MKNTILSTLIILAYIFAVSCEDAVNSDDNLYIVPDFDYSILYSTIDEANNTGAIYQSDLNGNKSLWKDSVFFMDVAVNNKLLLYYPVDFNEGIFKYQIHDFSNNSSKNLFDFQNIEKFGKILNEEFILLCEKYNEGRGTCIVLNIRDSSLYTINNSTTLASTIPAPNGNMIIFWDKEVNKFFVSNSYGSNKEELVFTKYGLPSSWSSNSEEIISTNVLLDSTHNYEFCILRVNFNKNTIDTLIRNEMSINEPKISPDSKKIIFKIYPNELALIDSDGNNFQILKSIKNDNNISSIRTFEWSPDSKYIIIQLLYDGEYYGSNYCELELINTNNGESKIIGRHYGLHKATWIKNK